METSPRKDGAYHLEELQAKPSSRRTRFILGIVLLLFFLLLLVAVYLKSPYAKIRAIAVKGATGLSASMLISDAQIKVGENLFLVSGSAVSQRLTEDFPIIKRVVLSRNLLQQSVQLVVEEKKIAGILDSGGSLYRLLSDGTVLDRDQEAVGINLPIITTVKPLTVNLGSPVNDPSVILLCHELSSIPASYLNSFSEFHLQPWQGTTAILAYSKDGFEVRMPIASLVSSLKLYLSIHAKLLQLHRKPGLIDLFNSHTGIYTPF